MILEPYLHPGIDLGPHLAEVKATLNRLQAEDITGRIWQKDHTVWKPEPREITNRLGWLNVTEVMAEQLPALQAFSAEIKEAGFRDVVLLGMGGSSLGPEVLRQVFGQPAGYPALTVLDTTVPASIRAVTEAIDPARTLFLVSSKSGGTIEPLSLYRYFRELVERASGQAGAGQSFAAITDAGTPLDRMAGEAGFRRTFLNPTDIGGRYSVLSGFGLVPAALIGVDITTMLERASGMRQWCNACIPARQNPGSWLGATMGTLALQGRDKLTMVTSPGIASFGLWVEQLIAESTGKEGKGIVPVAGEPLLSPDACGDDRLFVYLHLNDDDNAATDAAVRGLKSAGQPVVRLDLANRYDLGAEFFRWEMATAVAGAVLGINPFDQPNVQAAKDRTTRVLREYAASGQLPPVPATPSLADLLAGDNKGKYLAIMAYLHPTPEVARAFSFLRQQITLKYHLATTLGYGPRFLHSTGQLHKGGPDNGLFLQITAPHRPDLPIPGEPYTFGVLADAQARGDLQALREIRRPVVAVHLDRVDESAIRQLAEALS
ncbi:MAG: glucose-6-phosphate isomerase [Chloroflexota bacterium]